MAKPVAKETNLNGLFAKLFLTNHKVSDLNDPNNSIIPVLGDLCVVKIYHSDTEIITGQFAKLRQKGLPKTIDDSNVSELVLDIGKCLYEDAHFVYFLVADLTR